MTISAMSRQLSFPRSSVKCSSTAYKNGDGTRRSDSEDMIMSKLESFEMEV